jgi:DNA processing protein
MIATMSIERAFWLAWSRVPGLGAVLQKRLYQHFGSLEVAWTASADELAAIEGVGEFTASLLVSERSRLNPMQLLRQHEQDNPKFWTPADTDYPRLLREIPDPPPLLYYRGEVLPSENTGETPCIAIVGTRDPSDYGRRWTRKISAALAREGFTVVSGLATGVDTEAHLTCLRTGGRTIAVLGTGVDLVYPWANRGLAKDIAEHGLMLSEYPAGTQPDRVHFPRRNRIIAGLSRAVLVLEAPHKSGALITARLANDYCRDVYALPGSLDSPRSKGCLDLLNHGAQVILGEGHLMELLGAMPHIQLVHSAPAKQLDLLEPTAIDLEPELEQVLQVVTQEPVAFDLIVQQVGLATGAVLSALSQLEILGLIAALPGMRYQRC